jgi:uncharacterized protein
LECEWDTAKRSANLRKHGIDFEDATETFEGPYFEVPDDGSDHDELRFIAYGEAQNRVVVVVYTWRNDKRRLISARKATKAEREAYYNAVFRAR